jgi:hypothetical protein
VQEQYRRFLRDRLFSLGRTASRMPMRGTRLPMPVLRGDTPPSPAAPGRRQREVLIGMLLDHPFLIGEAHEEIAALDFPEPELDSLRRALLEADATSKGLDAEALRLHLGQSGFASTVDAVVLSLADHAGYLSRVGDAETVRSSWTHVTRMAREGDAPAGDLTTPETWERFLALQGREEQEGFSEDEFPPSRAEGISPR